MCPLPKFQMGHFYAWCMRGRNPLRSQISIGDYWGHIACRKDSREEHRAACSLLVPKGANYDTQLAWTSSCSHDKSIKFVTDAIIYNEVVVR